MKYNFLREESKSMTKVRMKEFIYIVCVLPEPVWPYANTVYHFKNINDLQIIY